MNFDFNEILKPLHAQRAACSPSAQQDGHHSATSNGQEDPRHSMALRLVSTIHRK
jgi:hypothetical protein